jgi:hypothetical protein
MRVNSALVELEHSVMAGRIAGARAEIMKRLEALRDLLASAPCQGIRLTTHKAVAVTRPAVFPGIRTVMFFSTDTTPFRRWNLQ